MDRQPDYFLRCELNPVAWKAPTAFAKRVGGQYRAATAPAPEVVAYQKALKSELARQWPYEQIARPMRVDLRFARRLESYKSETGRTVTKHRQDMTNLRKSTEDAMQGLVIKNDVLIVQGWTEIVAQSKNVAAPYVEIDIWLL